ncbi:hypothetical protein KO533_18980 [Shewanella sp. NKUCC05_KAH]|uniref:hypothetical protein n=1 Tax=Shewanella TaxID=22 RepID=UPI0001E4DCA6|nr:MULTISPECIES: hypothetical protein [Shewanella]AEG13588.1 hypothetical protein Sbal175_4376 [Shewanella baltica BA175]MBW3528637.1 hypothetical protein [Shewanella sp. NKUCC05_KAH]MCS6129775.1 hypothetical protein [Shewanella baltica]MCS6141680.1 hypothetical protein [Shewanella baltica]MCS6148014.1 hypothetical protein [Shewanella baltica]
MKNRDKLTNQDHDQMDHFIGAILEDYKNGIVSKEAVISGLGHVIAAIDLGNHDEARKWFCEGRTFIRETLND